MEKIRNMLDMVKIIYLISIFLPPVMFIAVKRLNKAELGSFVIGAVANAIICIIFFRSEVIIVFFSVVFSMAYILLLFFFVPAAIIASGLLYYAVLFRNASETKMAVSFSLGISQVSSLFCFIEVNDAVDSFIRRLGESKVHSDKEFINLYFVIIVVAVLKVIFMTASVFAVDGVYSAKKIPQNGKAVISSVIMALLSTAVDAALVSNI